MHFLKYYMNIYLFIINFKIIIQEFKWSELKMYVKYLLILELFIYTTAWRVVKTYQIIGCFNSRQYILYSNFWLFRSEYCYAIITTATDSVSRLYC